LTRRKGPDLAWVKARLGQCVGPVVTGGKVRWTRREGHDMAVFRFDTSDARVLSLARSNATLRQKIWANTSEGKTFVSCWQVRSSETESRGDDAKCKCRNGSDRWWLQAPSFFLLYFEYITSFGTAIQCYTLTQQYNHNIFLHTHTLYKSVGVASPQYAANTSGGSSEVGRSKSSRHHCARRGATTG
jgi:hypothetical protein